MMHFTPSEKKLIQLMQAVGGRYCPGRDLSITQEVQRIIRRLERKGALTVETVDDGYCFTLTEAAHASA